MVVAVSAGAALDCRPLTLMIGPVADAPNWGPSAPCLFKDGGGRDVPPPVPSGALEPWECDYLHASAGGADRFNAVGQSGGREEQERFLAAVARQADQAYAHYERTTRALLDKTDPDKVLETLPRGASALDERAALERASSLLWDKQSGMAAAARPFLWAQAHAASYLDPAAVRWPPSWKPYLRRFYDRDQALDRLIESAEHRIGLRHADDKYAEFQRELAQDPDMRDAVSGPGFDGALPVQPLPVPLSPKEFARRDYFYLGASAALKRFNDDYAIAVWHQIGETKTIGRPDAAARLIFLQKGESCGLATQYEVLRLRGLKVDIRSLAMEAARAHHGFHGREEPSDDVTVPGKTVGGTLLSDANWLLKRYRVPSRLIGVTSANTVLGTATPAELERSIRLGGGAIIIVRDADFYHDPTRAAGDKHSLFVSGAEVDVKTGRVKGYYVNDTATAEAKRYVPADELRKAWIGVMVSLAPAPRRRRVRG